MQGLCLTPGQVSNGEKVIKKGIDCINTHSHSTTWIKTLQLFLRYDTIEKLIFVPEFADSLDCFLC